jgi:hypothetical protein
MDGYGRKQLLLKRAEESEQKAMRAKIPEVKQTYEDLARTYRRLTGEVEMLYRLRHIVRRGEAKQHGSVSFPLSEDQLSNAYSRRESPLPSACIPSSRGCSSPWALQRT